MRTRLLALALVGGLGVAALPAHAASAKPQITDPTGDANAVNEQGIVSGSPLAGGQSGPADLSQADIAAVRFATTFVTKKAHGKTVKVPTGLTVTMTLAAAPSLPNIIYRVAASSTSCDSLYFEFSTAPNDSEPGSARCAKPPPTPSDPVAVKSVTVKGNTITWTVPLTSIPKNTVLSSLDAETRQVTQTPVVGITAPQYDYASTSTTFTVGK